MIKKTTVMTGLWFLAVLATYLYWTETEPKIRQIALVTGVACIGLILWLSINQRVYWKGVDIKLAARAISISTVMIALVLMVGSFAAGWNLRFWGPNWPCEEYPTMAPTWTCLPTPNVEATIAPIETRVNAAIATAQALHATVVVVETQCALLTPTITATPSATPTPQCRRCIVGQTYCGEGQFCQYCPEIGYRCVTIEHPLGDCNQCRLLELGR